VSAFRWSGAVVSRRRVLILWTALIWCAQCVGWNLTETACGASPLGIGHGRRDELSAAISFVERRGEGGGQEDHLEEHVWVVTWPPADDARYRGVQAVLYHAMLVGEEGSLFEVARHAFVPEAIAAYRDQVYLVFDEPGGRDSGRQIVGRGVRWNEASGRSFVIPPQGQPLPGLPGSGTGASGSGLSGLSGRSSAESPVRLRGFAADSEGLWALLSAASGASLGVRRAGASEARMEEPILVRLAMPLETHQWERVPFEGPFEGASLTAPANEMGNVEALDLLAGPDGVRVLYRRGAYDYLAAPSAGDDFAAIQPVGAIEQSLPRENDASEVREQEGQRFLRTSTANQHTWFLSGGRSGSSAGEVAGSLPPTRRLGYVKGASTGGRSLMATIRWVELPGTATGGRLPQVFERQTKLSAPAGRVISRWTALASGDSLVLLAVDDEAMTEEISTRIFWKRERFVEETRTAAASANDPAPPSVEGQPKGSSELRTFESFDRRQAWLLMATTLVVSTICLMLVGIIRMLWVQESGEFLVTQQVVAISTRGVALAMDAAPPALIAWFTFGVMPRSPIFVTSWANFDELNSGILMVGLTCLHTFLTEWLGGTSLGKRAVGAVVRSADGGELRLGQLLLRTAFKAMVLAAPVLAIATLFQRDRRMLSDIASGTAVVERRREGGP
jgi:uncharacterized RDD family membrane protein YckC